MVFCPYIYSNILLTLVKEFAKQDQQVKRILDNPLQGQKYLSYLFSLIVLKSGITLLRSFGKLNQQLNLKHNFSVLSAPKKTKGRGKRVLHCRMLHATKSDIDARLCSIHLPPMWHVACKKSNKKLCFFLTNKA